MNIKQIFLTIINDNENYNLNDETNIINTYNSMLDEDKDKIDRIFLVLTGFKLKTIIDTAEKR